MYYGGAVAAPVFREIADKVYSHFINMREPVNAKNAPVMGVQAFSKGYAYDYRTLFAELQVSEGFNDNEEWVAVDAQGKTADHTEIKTYKYTMPDVRGMGLRDALYLLEEYDLTVSVQGTGKVSLQSIPAGNAIKPKELILITLE